MSEAIQHTPHPTASGAINRRPKRGQAAPLRRRTSPVASSSKVLGCIVSEAVSRQLLTVRSAAKRVGMSPAQMSRVMRGVYGVRSVHLANLIVGLNLSAEYVMGAIYAENRRARETA